MSAVYHSYSHLSVPPRRRPWGELAGTLLTPKKKLPGIARRENGQRSNGKVSCVSPYKSLENRAICHPQNREDSKMSWVEAGDAAWASRSCHRNPGCVLCIGVGCLCAPGPVVPLAPLSLQGDVSSCCPEWTDKSGSEGRKRKWIDSVSHPIPWWQQRGAEGNWDFWKRRRALSRITSQPLYLCVRAEKESLLLFSSFPLRISKRLTRVGTTNIVPLFSLGEMQTLRALQLLAQGQYGIKIWNPNSLIVAASLGICYMH